MSTQIEETLASSLILLIAVVLHGQRDRCGRAFARHDGNAVTHWNRFATEILPVEVGPDHRLARHGDSARRHPRCGQRHRASLRALHRRPLVSRCLARCRRGERRSRRPDRVGIRVNGERIDAGIRRGAGRRAGWSRQGRGRDARSAGRPRESREEEQRWNRSRPVAASRGTNHRARLCANRQAGRLRLHSALRCAAARADCALSRIGPAHALRHRPRRGIVSRARIR